MAFASGKKAYGISDRSGFRYRLKDMRKEWNGLLVGKDEFEAKHPQLRSPRVGADPQALRDPRPETGLAEQRAFQYGFNPVGFKTIPGIIEENNLVATGQVGTVGFPATVAVTGEVATFSTGTLGFGVSFVLTGSSVTTSTGTVSFSLGSSISGSGSSSTGSVGTVTVVV